MVIGQKRGGGNVRGKEEQGSRIEGGGWGGKEHSVLAEG